MRIWKQVMFVGGLVAIVMMAAVSGTAQDDTSSSSNRGRRDFRRGRFDPERMRTMMLERIKERISATDEEWQVIEPLVESVMEKQRDARGGMMRGMMRPPGAPDGSGRPGGPMAAPDDEVGQISESLQTALDSKETSAKDIQAKLTALREARKKQESELKTARENLRKVLTLRQEASLVLVGLLD